MMITVLMTTPPYSGSTASDGLDFALAATNFGHDVAVLFSGDGVYQLLPEQQPPQGIKNQRKRVGALPFFDIDPLFVCADSVAMRAVEQSLLPDDVELLDKQALNDLLSRSQHVVTF